MGHITVYVTVGRQNRPGDCIPKDEEINEAITMTTLTIERSEELRDEPIMDLAIGAPILGVGDLETYLAPHQLNELIESLRPGESLVTDKFLDESITVGKEYEVRAIGQERYAKFVGRLKRIRPGYGWALTFEDVSYISSDESLVPVNRQELAVVFPREAAFTIYADSTPSGYGLRNFPQAIQVF